MDFNRRTAMATGLGAMLAGSGGTARATAPGTVTVQGESAVRTNIPVVRDRRATGGRYPGLRTTEKPPARTGWYATYTVRAPRAGVYTLTAVATAPVETPHTEAVASYLLLSVNEGPFTEIARSQPHWYESRAVWGDLSELDLGTVELRNDTNTFTFRVTEPTVLEDTTAYVLALDHFTLRHQEGHPALRELSVPRHREGEPRFPGAADEQHELARRHEADIPLWMTECGAFQKARPGTDLTPEQEIAQARYVVRSMVEGLAAGNDRQFWFAGPPLHDDGIYFGLLDRDFCPLPAYSAFAALTSLLGAARFTGPAPLLPDGVRGFVFDSGRGELVTVVWAERPVRLDRCGSGAVYDIMGRRLPAGQPVTASRDPLYLTSPAPPEVSPASPAASAAPPAASPTSPAASPALPAASPASPAASPPPRVASPGALPRPRARLSPAEHIVLAQRFSARNAAPGKEDGDAPPPHGYRLGRRSRLTVDVYNFGETARPVTVAARPVGGGWTVRAEQETRIRVPAGGRVGVNFGLLASSSVVRRTDRRLAFRATLDDRSEVPASVALIRLR
ncbi:hypothetical protein AB0929_32100 [Streptomyces massasporeus]|uniref:hypothetical protein n=1 Tax=Streptomyces massasporeus TaxID=67324 RepID=UPI003455EB2B